MDKILKSLSAFVLTFFLIYCLGSFSNYTLDISKWTEFSRGFVSIIGGLISLLAFGITYDRIDEN